MDIVLFIFPTDELEIIRDVGNSTLVNLTGVDQARVGIPQVIPACYKVIAESESNFNSLLLFNF